MPTSGRARPDPGDAVRARLGLQRAAPSNLRRHLVRGVVRVVRVAVLIVADLAAFGVMRELLRALRDQALLGPGLGEVLFGIFPRGPRRRRRRHAPANAQARGGAHGAARRAPARCRDVACLLREVEFTCGACRWIFAQSVFPQSTVQRHPWLRELGDRGLGESLSAVEDVRREPLEYLELRTADPLAEAAGAAGPLWARRAVYRLGGWPILVQEVFLPALGRCD